MVLGGPRRRASADSFESTLALQTAGAYGQTGGPSPELRHHLIRGGAVADPAVFPIPHSAMFGLLPKQVR
jgi:hypothetical protein